MLERSLEIAEVLRGEKGDDEDRKPVCTYFGKKFRKFISLEKLPRRAKVWHKQAADIKPSTVDGEKVPYSPRKSGLL